MDLSTLVPQRGTGLTRKAATRVAEANPFVDNGWLWDSYQMHMDNGSPEGADMFVDVPGEYVTAVRKRGDNKGKEYQKLTGDAAKVVRWLREAADRHEIGVAIEVVPATRVVNEGRRNERIDEIPGMMRVKYLGKVRKQYTSKDGETEEPNGNTPEDDDDTGPDIGEDDETEE